MKNFRFVPVLLLSLMLFTGCDFFRSLVGKPTSKELEKMKIEAEAQARKARQEDSLRRVQEELLKMEAEKSVSVSDLEKTGRYHVIMGSFKVEGNAEKMAARLEKDGYSPIVFMFENGFESVSVAGFDTLREALEASVNMYEKDYTPDDVWVYDVKKNIHVK